jgi:hypothetical protein
MHDHSSRKDGYRGRRGCSSHHVLYIYCYLGSTGSTDREAVQIKLVHVFASLIPVRELNLPFPRIAFTLRMAPKILYLFTYLLTYLHSLTYLLQCIISE